MNNFQKLFYYKGFTVDYVCGEYRAKAYANPSFYSTNKASIKKQINEYLNS